MRRRVDDERNGSTAMTEEVLGSAVRRKVLAGLGTVAIGATAASPVGHAALATDERTKMGAPIPSVCVFDVNETLLDIEFIAPLFERHCLAIGRPCASGLDSSSFIRGQ